MKWCLQLDALLCQRVEAVRAKWLGTCEQYLVREHRVYLVRLLFEHLYTERIYLLNSSWLGLWQVTLGKKWRVQIHMLPADWLVPRYA